MKFIKRMIKETTKSFNCEMCNKEVSGGHTYLAHKGKEIYKGDYTRGDLCCDKCANDLQNLAVRLYHV